MEEIFKYLAGPIIVAFLAYWFGIRGKQRDIDNLKIRELNTVLSNLLISWHYLSKIDELIKLSTNPNNKLIFPSEYLSFIVFKSNTINMTSFDELEDSIKLLKQYDPITYYKLEGIGKRFDYIEKNYAIPFLRTSPKANNIAGAISTTFLLKVLEEVEDYMISVSTLISKKTNKQIKSMIAKNKSNDDLVDSLNKEYYEILMSVIPEGIEKPNYEEFEEEFKKPEVQVQLKRQFDIIVNEGVDSLMSITTKTPVN